MVGLICDTRKIITHGFKAEGDIIAVLGEMKDDLTASEFAQTILGRNTGELIEAGVSPQIDLETEAELHNTMSRLTEENLLRSAHDCSDGGLAVAIAESCFSSLGRPAIGAEIALKDSELSKPTLLFGETPSRIVVSFAPENETRIKELVGDRPMFELGRVTGDTLNISVNGETVVSSGIDELQKLWSGALASTLEN